MKSPTEFLRAKAARAWRTLLHFGVLSVAACVALADNVFAQTAGNSPWENAVQVLQRTFTGPIATGLALVAIVVEGVPEGCLGGRHDTGPNLLPCPCPIRQVYTSADRK
jgi:TrbC/VIRB2 pilin